MSGLQRRLREQDAVVRDDADQKSIDARESGDKRRTVARLELVELRTVDEACDHFVHVVGPANVGIDDAVEIVGGIERILWLGSIERHWWRHV